MARIIIIYKINPAKPGNILPFVRKIYALTFKLVKSEARSDVAFPDVGSVSETARQMARLSGLPRACGPRC
jgi:hypothetical protein